MLLAKIIEVIINLRGGAMVNFPCRQRVDKYSSVLLPLLLLVGFIVGCGAEVEQQASSEVTSAENLVSLVSEGNDLVSLAVVIQGNTITVPDEAGYNSLANKLLRECGANCTFHTNRDGTITITYHNNK